MVGPDTKEPLSFLFIKKIKCHKHFKTQTLKRKRLSDKILD